MVETHADGKRIPWGSVIMTEGLYRYLSCAVHPLEHEAALPQAPCSVSSRIMQRDKVVLWDDVQDVKSGLDPKLGLCFCSLQSQITPCFPSADFDSAWLFKGIIV